MPSSPWMDMQRYGEDFERVLIADAKEQAERLSDVSLPRSRSYGGIAMCSAARETGILSPLSGSLAQFSREAPIAV